MPQRFAVLSSFIYNILVEHNGVRILINFYCYRIDAFVTSSYRPTLDFPKQFLRYICNTVTQLVRKNRISTVINIP